MNLSAIEEWDINATTEFNRGLDDLKTEISKFDVYELLSRMFIIQIQNFDLTQGYSGVLPIHQEYITGILSNSNTLKTGTKIPTFEDINNIIEIIDKKLIPFWKISNYTRKLKGAKVKKDFTQKSFEAAMVSNYGLIRGYSWFSNVSDNQLKELFKPISHELTKLLGFNIEDIYFFLVNLKKYLEYKLNYSIINYSIINVSDLSDLDIYFNDTIFKEILFFDVDDIIKLLSIDKNYRDIFLKILDFFNFELSNNDNETYKYFSDENVYKRKPIIKYGDKFLLQNFQNFEIFLKDNITDYLKSKKEWKRYLDIRGQYLENKTKEIFGKIFKDSIYYDSLYYSFKGDRCELDGLLIHNNTIFLIEAKSAQFHESAKRGGMKRLRDNIFDNIEFASKQAMRSKEYILSSDTVEFMNKQGKKILTIRNKDYQELYVVNVTLEQFADLSVELYKLKQLDIYKSHEYPWSISLNDLEVLSDFLNSPSEFIHYSNFRKNMDGSVLGEFIIPYELDLLVYYCNDFYFEDDMVKLDVDLENLMYQVYKNNTTIETQGKTVVDASRVFNEYYNSKAKGKIVNKLCRRYNPKYKELINKLVGYKKNGSASFILYLLELSLDQQNLFISYIDNLINKYNNDKKDHNISIPNQFTERYSIRTCGATIFVANEKDRAIVFRNAALWCQKKKIELNSTDWIGIIYFIDEFNNIKNEFILTGDSLYGIDNLGKIESNPNIGRNELCPCNSGKKYKKCHGKVSNLIEH